MVIQPLIIIRAAAIAAGLVVIWILKNDHKKKRVEIFLSLLTTWLLSFIAAKFVTRWDLLFDYPLSVLSYPGGTRELYIATIITIMFEWRQRNQHSRFVDSSLIILATSLLGFALLRQLVLDHGHLVDLLFAFVFFLLVVLKKWGTRNIAIASSLGALVGLVYRSPELMGYRIDVGFYILTSLLLWTCIFLRNGKPTDKSKGL